MDHRWVLNYLFFAGDTGVGKSFLLQLYSMLINHDPQIVFNGRRHLVSVLRSAGARQQLPDERPRPAEHANEWAALKDLPDHASPADIIIAVKNLVLLDQQPHVQELGAAIATYFDVISEQFPLMRDGAKPALKTLLNTASNIRNEQQRAIAFATAKAADNVPDEVIDYGEASIPCSFTFHDYLINT